MQRLLDSGHARASPPPAAARESERLEGMLEAVEKRLCHVEQQRDIAIDRITELEVACCAAPSLCVLQSLPCVLVCSWPCRHDMQMCRMRSCT